ncbi:hypothetical protein [Limnoglobus roseus]|uniref:hypothetical protein n=1 Tax=Limnoglobus roseus TaxID=2598579 RepID=UPI0011EB5D48|nr:hypothetical protein [Limnoglobus roseus]
MKKPTPAVEPDSIEALMADIHRPTGFEMLHDALEDLRDFFQALDEGDSEDCLLMLVKVGLLSRFVNRVERGNNFVQLDEDNPLDNALNKLLGPLSGFGPGGIHSRPSPIVSWVRRAG